MKWKNMKDIFSEKIDRDKIYESVLLKENSGKSRKTRGVVRYGTFIFVLCLCGFIMFFWNKEEYKEKNDVDFLNSVKIFAYDSSKMVEFRENVRLKLEKYNPAMSMVPGYPIYFEIGGDVDSIQLDVTNGSVFKFDGDKGTVDPLETPYVLRTSETLCFQVQKDTVISVLGFQNGKEVVKRRIVFSSDDDFNYYATIQ